MLRLLHDTYIRWVILLIIAMQFFSVSAQISESVTAFKFGLFNITSARKSVNGHYVLYISIFKGNGFIAADSVVTDAAACNGFAFPAVQPFKDFFIFSKHAPHSGRTYILTRLGSFASIGGGTFWAAPKDKLLFILAEKDYRNLVVFSLKEMKTVFEKYSCDEFTDWFYRHGTYFGKVSTECGSELKSEKEVSEWMHPVEIEQFDVKAHTLNEMHITDEQVERAKPLIKYASCK
jgi:hypothetical protein